MALTFREMFQRLDSDLQRQIIDDFFQELLDEVGQATVLAMQEKIDNASSWATPLDKTYEKRKVAQGYPKDILIRTGQLRNSGISHRIEDSGSTIAIHYEFNKEVSRKGETYNAADFIIAERDFTEIPQDLMSGGAKLTKIWSKHVQGLKIAIEEAFKGR